MGALQDTVIIPRCQSFILVLAQQNVFLLGGSWQGLCETRREIRDKLSLENWYEVPMKSNVVFNYILNDLSSRLHDLYSSIWPSSLRSVEFFFFFLFNPAAAAVEKHSGGCQTGKPAVQSLHVSHHVSMCALSETLDPTPAVTWSERDCRT